MVSQILALLAVVAWFLAGALVEVLNNLARHWTVGRLGLQGQGRPVLFLLLGYVGRLVVTSVILLLAFRHNVVSGVAALVGYWVCRWALVWRLHRRVSKNRFRASSGHHKS